ncbi:hypothetical protein ABZ639_18030 [Saccharomonospora sp. NPDC006951]
MGSERHDNAEVADIVSRARNRDDGFDYGEDRAIGDRPNWEARDSARLYRYATENNEPGSAEELGQAWADHGSTLGQAAEDLYTALSGLGAAWVGQGAGFAQGALVAIANSSAQASAAATTMSTRLAQQAVAAAELKKMPQPSEFDPGSETAAMLAGGPAAMVRDMKIEFDAARDTKAQQVAYLEAYTVAMEGIDDTTPSFGPDSLGLTPAAPAEGSGVQGFGTAGTQQGGLSAGLAEAPGNGTTTSSASTTVQAGAQAVTAHGPALSGPPTSPGAGPAVGGLATGAGALSSGHRSGATKQQSAETPAPANRNVGARTVQPQSQGVVPQSGMIGGHLPPATPMGGVGAMGGAGARQDEEREHTHASFLIDPDPDDTFGAAVATPPPVLGAWGPDDDEER